MQTYQIFLKAFPEINYYEHEYNGEKYGIDIIEMTTQYLFASCSVSNNITPTSFMQIRNVETKQREPFNIDNLEKYTYLLLEFCSNRMVVMSGKGLSKITEVIVNFMNINTGGLSDIAILAEKIEDFDKNAKRFSKISDIEFKVSGVSTDYVPDVQSALAGLSVESYTIKVKIAEKTKDLFSNLRHLKDSNSKIKGIKAHGKNEHNIDDIIDYFSTQFTKTIPIDVNNDSALNQDYIKNKLLSALK